MSGSCFFRMMPQRILPAIPTQETGMAQHPPIPGTVIFDGARAIRGFAPDLDRHVGGVKPGFILPLEVRKRFIHALKRYRR